VRPLQRLIAIQPRSRLFFGDQLNIAADFAVEILVHTLLIEDVSTEVVEAMKWHLVPMSPAKRSQRP